VNIGFQPFVSNDSLNKLCDIFHSFSADVWAYMESRSVGRYLPLLTSCATCGYHKVHSCCSVGDISHYSFLAQVWVYCRGHSRSCPNLLTFNMYLINRCSNVSVIHNVYRNLKIFSWVLTRNLKIFSKVRVL
jgi:hypothetical protein